MRLAAAAAISARNVLPVEKRLLVFSKIMVGIMPIATMPAMHLHVIGICGTFMGGLAQLARSCGFRVTGCDANVYPPMSTQLAQAGIEVIQGF